MCSRIAVFSDLSVVTVLFLASLISGFAGGRSASAESFIDANTSIEFLEAPFQNMKAHLTPDGLWIQSTEGTQPSVEQRFRVVAMELRREKGVGAPLAKEGSVGVTQASFSLIRPKVVEEYRVNMDGIRQDFLIAERPHGEGNVVVSLSVSGAKVDATTYGAKLTLPTTKREIAYCNLHVTDALGHVLEAEMVVPDAATISIVVDDRAATYPIRIDPTFSDTDWISMGGIPGANDNVDALMVDESGNLYAGGAFTAIGNVAANNVAKWDGSQWSALGSGTDESVEAFAISGNNLYVGGNFTTAGGLTANHVAMWDGATWSTLGSGFDSSVRALTMYNGQLHAGGWFETSGGTATSGVARWDGNDWQPLGTGLTNDKTDLYVSAFTVAGGNLYVGGSFRMAGTIEALNVAFWNGVEWAAMGDGLGTSNASTAVNTIALFEGEIHAGGKFSTSGSATVNNLAIWGGTSWSAMGQGVDDYVNSMAVSGPTLYVGGRFRHAGGSSADYLATWNGSMWTPLGEGTEDTVSAIAIHNDTIYIGGGFVAAGNVNASYIARLESNGNWSSLGSGFNDSVNTIATAGSEVFVGGWFTASPGGPANHVAKWDGSSWSALGEGVNGTVRALAVEGDSVYVGGDFDRAGDVTANHVAKWNGTSWSALGDGTDATVFALAADGTDLYIGGAFQDAGSITGNGIAMWNGSVWSALGSGMGSAGPFPFFLVSSLATAGTDLYAGGQFATAGGVTANSIAKWNGTSWAALGSGVSMGEEPFASVSAIELSGNDLYAAGLFTEAGGVPANSVAKWNGSSWSALGSGIEAKDPSSGDTFVGEGEALTMIDGELVIGGFLETAGGVPAKGIAKWDGVEWSAIGSGTDQAVRALGGTTTGIFVGGGFHFAGTKLSPYLALARTPTTYSGPYVVLGNGDVTVYLLVPGAGQYDIQRSTTLAPGSWAKVGSVSATAAEVISFTDTNPSSGEAYYRAVQASL